jgi:hypothetical protein
MGHAELREPLLMTDKVRGFVYDVTTGRLDDIA